jgi:hypothetical protein
MAEYAEKIRRGDDTLKQSELDAMTSRLKIGNGESYATPLACKMLFYFRWGLFEDCVFRSVACVRFRSVLA